MILNECRRLKIYNRKFSKLCLGGEFTELTV